MKRTGFLAAALACRRAALLLAIIAILPFQPVFGSASPPSPYDYPHPIDIEQGLFFVQPTSLTGWHLDEDGERTLAEMVAQPDAFSPFGGEWLDFGLTDAVIWLRFPLRNASGEDGEWIVDLQRPMIAEADIWIVRQGGEVEELLSVGGPDQRFDDRPVDERFLSARFTMASNERADIFVRARSDTTTFMPVTFATEELADIAHTNEDAFNTRLNGALLALMLVGLLMGRVIGWKIALAFLAYLSSGFLFVYNSEGYTIETIWRDTPYLAERAENVLYMAMSVAAVTFARLFFDTAKHFPGLDRLLRLHIIVAAILGVVALLLPASRGLAIAGFDIVVIGSLIHLTTAIRARIARLPGAAPFVIGSSCIFLTLMFTTYVHLNPGRYSLASTLDLGHLALIVEGGAFMLAVVLRLIRMRDRMNEALKAELRSSEEKLKLSDALRESQLRFDAARRQAEARRAQLASASHDLRQPLLSLRSGLAKIGERDPETGAQMRSAFDYLEELARSQLSETAADDHALSQESAAEIFSVHVVLDNVRAMFAEEARAKGLALRYVPCSASVEADPVTLIRIVSNLVSNAIKYTDRGAILIGCRRLPGTISIEVHDNGRGMTENELARALEPYEKGEDSNGAGLGLHLASTMSEAQGFGFSATSEKGRGSSFRIRVPHVPAQK